MALLAEDKAGLKRGAELRDGAALWGPAALGPLFPASPDASRTSGLVYRDQGFHHQCKLETHYCHLHSQ